MESLNIKETIWILGDERFVIVLDPEYYLHIEPGFCIKNGPVITRILHINLMMNQIQVEMLIDDDNVFGKKIIITHLDFMELLENSEKCGYFSHKQIREELNVFDKWIEYV